MEILEITEKQYEKFLNKFDDTLFFQSVEWCRFKSKTGWNMNIIGLFDDKKIVASSILLSRNIPIINKKMYYSPRGFIIDYNNLDLIKEFTCELKKYLKNNNGIFLKINPYVKYIERDKDGNPISKPNDKLVDTLKSLNYKHYGFYINQDEKKDLEPRWMSVLDIKGKDIDTILKETRQTTRWRINKSFKNCITIKDASYDDIKDFKMIMNHTAERREFADRAISYYETMYKEINPSILRILLASIDLKKLKNTLNKEKEELKEKIDNAKRENQIKEFENQLEALEKKLIQIDDDIKSYGDNPYVAAGLYLTYKKQIVYLFGGSYKEFMSYGAQYLMQYEMIKYGIERNVEKFNFYGIDGNFSKDSKGYGLFDFKRGFNSDVVELIGEFDLIVNRFYYNLYNFMMWGYKKLRKIKGKKE